MGTEATGRRAIADRLDSIRFTARLIANVMDADDKKTAHIIACASALAIPKTVVAVYAHPQLATNAKAAINRIRNVIGSPLKHTVTANQTQRKLQPASSII